MNDPHVERLHYDLVLVGSAMFSGTAPFEVNEAPRFRLSYAGKRVIFEMMEHHATVESALGAVEPYLSAWEIDDALTFGRQQISFRFDHADVIDRDPPPPPEPGVAQNVVVTSVAASARAVGGIPVVSRPFPKPPTGFAVDPDVRTLWHRWRGYQEGQEHLQTTAYVCLTVVKRHGERAAAKRLGISVKVLKMIGRLSHLGDEATARKWTPNLRPLTANERAWLEAAVKMLIRRSGEVAAAPTAPLPQITMADLPPP